MSNDIIKSVLLEQELVEFKKTTEIIMKNTINSVKANSQANIYMIRVLKSNIQHIIKFMEKNGYSQDLILLTKAYERTIAFEMKTINKYTIYQIINIRIQQMVDELIDFEKKERQPNDQ